MKISFVSVVGAVGVCVGVGLFVSQRSLMAQTSGPIRTPGSFSSSSGAAPISGSPGVSLKSGFSSRPGELMLGAPVSLARFGLSPNWKIFRLIAGQEAHLLLSNTEDVLRPQLLVWNRIDDKGLLPTQVIPLLQPPPRSDQDPTHVSPIQDSERYFAVLDPQFSSDGHRLLAKYGRLGSPGNYRLVVCDLAKHQIRFIGPTDLYYNAVSWSPDGKFVAFARGGAVDPHFYEFGATTEGPLELCVVNVASGRVQSVARSAFLRGPWSWGAPHTLFYSAPAPKNEAASHRATQKQVPSPVLPNVYTFNPEQRKARLVVRAAWHPVASPDGKNVACFDAQGTSAASRMTWPDTPTGARLVIVGVGQTAQPRAAIATASKRLPLLQWEPDNLHLLLMSLLGRPPISHLRIEECNVQTLQKRLVTTLEARDPDEARSPNDPDFSLTGPVTDGHLMVRVNEYFEPIPDHGALGRDTLQDVELASGCVRAILQTEGATGTAWSYAR